MHTFTQTLVHIVWSTQERECVLTPEVRDRLWPYLGGIARQHGMSALAIGGVSDHLHLLISLPPTLALSKAVQLLKGNLQMAPRDLPETRQRRVATRLRL